MSINLSVPNSGSPELKPKITIVGVGGAGGNAINNMIQSQLEGTDFVVCNTDAQALSQSKAEHRIQLGAVATAGLGAGSQPNVGRVAAEEALEEIMGQIGSSHMIFVAAGMGGGTGTGAAPVIARAAKERGVLTVGVVTKPFQFEGAHRMAIAEDGIKELEQYVDTLIVIPNQNLFRIANERELAFVLPYGKRPPFFDSEHQSIRQQTFNRCRMDPRQTLNPLTCRVQIKSQNGGTL